MESLDVIGKKVERSVHQDSAARGYKPDAGAGVVPTSDAEASRSGITTVEPYLNYLVNKTTQN